MILKELNIKREDKSAQDNDIQDGDIQCDNCGKFFSRVELNQINDILVCDDCKHLLLEEGLIW